MPDQANDPTPRAERQDQSLNGRRSAPQGMFSLGAAGALNLSPGDQDPRDSPGGQTAPTDGAAEAPSWRIGTLSAALAGLGIGQVWFRVVAGWVLYDDVSFWVIPLGAIAIAIGGARLGRRWMSDEWSEGISRPQVAWAGAVIVGAVLGLIQLISEF